ncbi:MAG TPA: type II toxin-antitoxin system Phd/YefM family antitoxin [Caldilineae bacterium]|nr:type II toxin-antitoxin system Phd/YefM family antitoxin [Caldilineae bacterium]
MNGSVITAMELRRAIGDILNRIEYTRERFIVKRKGKPVAAIIAIEDLEHLERLEAEREIEMLRLAKKAADEMGTVPFQELIEEYQELHGERLELP